MTNLVHNNLKSRLYPVRFDFAPLTSTVFNILRNNATVSKFSLRDSRIAKRFKISSQNFEVNSAESRNNA